MKIILAGLVASTMAAPLLGQDVAEARSGVKFESRSGDLVLTGIGLRTRTMLKVKVYAIGLYVSEAALNGPLKGKTGAALYRDLVWGDFPKQVVLKFVRDVTAAQIQDAFREALAGAPKQKVDAFVSYFGATKQGQEYVIRWAPGGVLETTVAGEAKPPIADKDFAAAVFGIWLGEKPIQEDLKKDLVSRR